jgi:hypothetical protein
MTWITEAAGETSTSLTPHHIFQENERQIISVAMEKI